MLDVRVVSSVFRRWRLPALVTGITLVGGAAAVRSTVERLHHRAGEVRRLRARLADRQREIDRQRQELAVIAAAVDDLVPSTLALGSHATPAQQAGEPAESRAAQPRLVAVPAPRVDDATPPGTMRTIATLAWEEEQIARSGASLVGLIDLASKWAREARAVPTLWPVRGRVSSPFGWRPSPYGGEPEWHPGIDIVAAYGTPVRATADGEVVFAGPDGSYGASVVLDHGAATTRYAHLSAIWVRPGQSVRRGDRLGALGGTGRVTAPHLHYEVRVGNEPLDPECLLEDRCGPPQEALRRRGAVTSIASRSVPNPW
ncbi:MAG TPA: M23 family metallopeptidase [Candidatus Eisenbacteria bacterium]|nr:M23 family metallopeptidase [Candidatus Eisenbacteria bacterium]